MNITKSDHDAALEYLRTCVPRGSTVYLVLEHVSSSGMSRWIKCYAVKDGEMIYISWYVEQVTGAKRSRRRDGNFVGGCGMDMGFALVSDLSYRLYGNNYELNHRWL